MFNFPTIEDFQVQFVRDFPYSTDPNAGVTTTDIGNAYQLVNVNWTPNLFSTQSSYTLGYLYLAAHYLCLCLRASSQGINGQYNWVQNSKSVQGVTESFTVPERLANSIFWQQLTKTNYGSMYFNLVYPSLIAPIFIAPGRTRP